MSRRHRPTEHSAVFLSEPFVPDDALDDLFPNQAGTYLHKNLLVNTLALFYFLFLVILPTSAASVCWSMCSSRSPNSLMKITAGRCLCCHNLTGIGCLPLPGFQGAGVTLSAAIRPPAQPQTSPRRGDSQKSQLTRGKRH